MRMHYRSSELLEFIEIDEGNVSALYELSSYRVTPYFLDLLGLDGSIERYVTSTYELFFIVNHGFSATGIAAFAEIDNAEYMDSYINDESYFNLLSDLPELDSGYVGESITSDETLGYADYELLSAVLSPHGGLISGTREYSFDNRGNRIRMVVSGAETYTVTYTYDLNNRLLSTDRTGSNPQQLPSLMTAMAPN